MLVLGIKRGDTLVIGDAVVSFDRKGRKWRVRIAAPPEVKVLRSELRPETRKAG